MDTADIYVHGHAKGMAKTIGFFVKNIVMAKVRGKIF